MSPIHAAAILKFQERDEWPLSELAHALKMCSFALRKKLSFWKAQGLIAEKGSASGGEQDEVYCLVKESSGKLGRANRMLTEFDEDEEHDRGERI